MKIEIIFVLALCGVSYGCIGTGCIHDRAEDRFYWFSNRAKSEIDNIIEQGGPSAYCQSLGMFVTSAGTLMNRALEVERMANINGNTFINPHDPNSGKMDDTESRDPTQLWPQKTICHEMKWT